jgi:hypothetical protein
MSVEVFVGCVLFQAGFEGGATVILGKNILMAILAVLGDGMIAPRRKR